MWREKGDQLKEVDKNIFLSRRINAYLDRGNSQCWLNNSDVAELVEESIQFFHEDRYQLLAWVVMPNHVHVLLVLKNDASLDQILHSWKSYSAQKANRILGREGPFWQEEYWDRYIRNEEHLATVYNYILDNPVHANLVDQREQWEWSGNQEEL